MLRKVTLFLLISMLAVSLFAAGANQPAPAQSAGPRTVVRLATTETFTMLDPHYNTRAVDNTLAAQVFEGFFFVTPFGELEPRLATKMEVSPDSKVITYYLKKGVKFHTGNPFTAKDVIFSFARAKAAPPMQAAIGAVDKVEALDDFTVRITLKEVNPMFYATGNIGIIDSIAGANVKPGFYQPNIGTGPYTLTEWNDGMRVVMDRFEDWHMKSSRALPQIKRQIRNVLSDQMTGLMALESDEIDYFGVPAAEWKRIEASGKFTTMLQPSWHTTYMVFNTTKKPFDDVRVRQAFRYALNKKDILLAALEGLGDVAYTMGNPFYITAIKDLDKEPGFERGDYNPQKAKQLLAEAGYPNGIVFTSPSHMGSLASIPHFMAAVEVIQQQLKEVGITIPIVTGDPATYWDNMYKGNYFFDISGWSWTTFDAFWIERRYSTAHIGDVNSAQYSNPEVDRLFRVAGTTMNQDVRRQAFRDALKIVSRDVPDIPLYYQKNRLAWNKNLVADPNRPTADWYWK